MDIDKSTAGIHAISMVNFPFLTCIGTVKNIKLER
jgi:hypothetical protein